MTGYPFRNLDPPTADSILIIIEYLWEALGYDSSGVSKACHDASPDSSLGKLIEKIIGGHRSLIRNIKYDLDWNTFDQIKERLRERPGFTEQRSLKTLESIFDSFPALRDALAPDLSTYKWCLNLLVNPRSKEEATLSGATADAFKDALDQLKSESSNQSWVEQIKALIPDQSVIKHRQKMLLVPSGQITRSKGKTQQISAFLMDREPLPVINTLYLDAAIKTLQARGCQLPTFEQLLRAKQLGVIQSTRHTKEWLKGFQRNGRTTMGQVISFKTLEKTWIPTHLPGPGISARGVVEL